MSVKPVPTDFIEEFPYFVDGSNIEKFKDISIKQQLREQYDVWISTHKRKFSTFEDFLKAACVLD